VDHAAGAVVAAESVVVERLVFLGGAAKQVDLFGVKHAAGQRKTLPVKFSNKGFRERFV
jgi:hypothetical protein